MTAAPRARLGNALVITIPALFLAVMGYRYRWLADDGDIVMRTVRQILAGNGPVFNAGERAEVNTSALWTWLLAAVCFVTRLSVYRAALVISLLLAPASLVLAADGTRRLLSSRTWFVPAGALVVAALPPFWEYTTSGLESSLIFCWLGLAWWLLVRTRPGSRGAAPHVTAFVCGLGWLVRPDMAVASVFFLAALVVTLKPVATCAVSLSLAACTVPFGYQIFRMGYYAEIVPNTAIDKSAGSLVAGRGWAYLLNYSAPYSLWIPVLLLAALLAWQLPGAGLPRCDLWKIAAAEASGLVMAAYVVAIGGDFMHGRMLLPATFAALTPAMVLPVPDVRRVPVFAALVSCVFAWALTCASVLRMSDPARVDGYGVTDERAFWLNWTGANAVTTPGPFLLRRFGSLARPTVLGAAVRAALDSQAPEFVYHTSPARVLMAPLSFHAHAVMAVNGGTLGMFGAGVPLDAIVVDDRGLAYPLASHLQGDAGKMAGWGKPISLAWELADYAAPGYTSPEASAAQIAAARAALRCGAIARLQAAVRAPLTWGRFWDNLLHAYSFTRLTIPADPVAAERTMCRRELPCPYAPRHLYRRA